MASEPGIGAISFKDNGRVFGSRLIVGGQQKETHSWDRLLRCGNRSRERRQMHIRHMVEKSESFSFSVVLMHSSVL